MEKYLGIDLYQIVLHDRENKYSMKDIIDFVEQKLESSYYLITQEKEESNKHYHIMVRTQVNKKDKANRPIRKLIKELGITGTGNSGTSLVRSKNQMMKYILKDDGEVHYRGIDEKTIKLMKKLSVKKGDFNKRKFELEEKYMGDINMSFKAYAREYIKLELEYGHNMRSSSQKPYLLKIYLKKNPDKIPEYIDNMFKFEII